MKKNSYKCILFVMSALAVFFVVDSMLMAADKADYRIWTNLQGKKIEAILLNSDDSKITLEMRNGREYQLKLTEVSKEDAEYVAQWVEKRSELEKIAEQPKPSTAPVMAMAGKLLFSDDFSAIAGDWRHPMGDWEAKDGVLKGAELAKDDHGAVFKRKLPFKNAIIEFSFKLDGAKGISLSIDDEKEHVCRMSMNAAGFTVQKDDHDHDGPDKGMQFDRLSTEFKAGEWYTARIEILGDEMLGQIGEEIGFGSHELIGTDKAKLGFTVAGQSAEFKDLKVWEALPNEGWEKMRRRLERKKK